MELSDQARSELQAKLDEREIMLTRVMNFLQQVCGCFSLQIVFL
jgi:hypothetical protein